MIEGEPVQSGRIGYQRKTVNQPYAHSRRAGKSDVVLIVVIAIVITAATLLALFHILNQSEEHVKNVKKTKVSYSEALQWHPEENDCDVKIKEDFEKNPDATKGKYSRYDLTEKSLKYISRMHKMKSLNLKESTIKDEWLSYLENLPLAYLSLYGTKISDAGAQHLAKIKTLHQLDLTDTDVTDASMGTLATLPILDNLQLVRTDVTNEGVAMLQKKATKLVNLELADTKVTADCLATLGSFPNLSNIEIAGIAVKPDDLAQLKRLKLTTLSADRCGIGDEEAKVLSEFKALYHLDIDENPITDAGLMHFKKTKTMLNLQMRGCPNITGRGIAELRKALPKCQISHSFEMKKKVKFGDDVIDEI